MVSMLKLWCTKSTAAFRSCSWPSAIVKSYSPTRMSILRRLFLRRRQCAAVSTHCGPISTPPQYCSCQRVRMATYTKEKKDILWIFHTFWTPKWDFKVTLGRYVKHNPTCIQEACLTSAETFPDSVFYTLVRESLRRWSAAHLPRPRARQSFIASHYLHAPAVISTSALVHASQCCAVCL